MDLQLKGKRAFVSGSSSGIGKGIALELAAAGCDVVVHGRDRKRAEETAREVEKLGVKAVVTVGDLTKDADATKVCDAALAAVSGIDILINNAGITLRKDNPGWENIKPQEWMDSFNVNFVSGLRLAQRFVPAMKEKRWGRVVNISTTAGTHVLPGGMFPEYGAPKAGLNKFTADMAKAVGPFGITVNAIIPGTIMTPAIVEYMSILKTQRGWGNDQTENERRYTEEIFPQSVPRLGKIRDIAAATAFLASPLAGYINGAFLRIDGGMANFA
jgi:NAD(P)-dependent dehydrogenase (short-subunit alcohol dehydrogenase family)